MGINSTLYLKDSHLPLDACVQPKVTKIYYQVTHNHPEWAELARKFPNLKDLELCHKGNIANRVPDAALFSCLPKLEFLSALNLHLTSMYKPPKHNKALRHLTLSHCEGDSLPSWLKTLPNMGELTLKKPNLVSLGDLSALAFLSKVNLELHHYDNPYDLPITNFDNLLIAPALQELEIELSPHVQDMTYLAPLACLVDLPEHITLALHVSCRIARSDELNKLLGILKHAELTDEQRRRYWLLLLATPKPKNLAAETLDARFHLTFMEAKFNPVKVLAQDWLRKRAQSDVARRPLSSDSVLFICGKSGFKATELKEKAAELGFGISKKLDNSVTHIVLGSNPKQTAAIDVDQHLIIDDTALSQWFSAAAPKFLQQQDAASMQGNVLDMLRSPDEASHLVAATMLEQGGITTDMLLPLFLVLKTTDNKALRKQIQTLLTGHGDNAFQLAVQDKVFFDGKMRGLNHHGEPQGEGPVYKKLKGLTKRWGKTLCDEFSLLYFNRFGEGLLWLLAQKEESEARDIAIAQLIEGETLNWHRGCGFARILAARGEAELVDCHWAPEIYLAREELRNVKTRLPKQLPQQSKITTLDLHNCVLKALPVNIDNYIDVTHLNLHFNVLSTLPSKLTALQNLQELDLSYNHFNEFPAELFKLKNLKRLDIRRASAPLYRHGYDQQHGYTPIRAPQAFRDAFPDCEILEDTIDSI
ncbi:BRCT domain-containing protein [Photobacterium nomapromontoriensis]|uniref:BRCT domain-containing protein n=1 Tax=Photobacterium nomapromontoriensis TaxID=2910237 RepID=UPI003D1153EE